MRIPKTLSKWAHMIESIDDERAIQNGYWVNLKPGYFCRWSETHAIHENTLRSCATYMQSVEPCACEDCQKSIELRKGAR